MDISKICICCLSKNGMFPIGNSYEFILKLLVGNMVPTRDMSVCTFCQHSLKKVYNFRNMCYRAQNILKDHTAILNKNFTNIFKNEPSYTKTLLMDISIESCPSEILSVTHDRKPRRNSTSDTIKTDSKPSENIKIEIDVISEMDLKNDDFKFEKGTEFVEISAGQFENDDLNDLKSELISFIPNDSDDDRNESLESLNDGSRRGKKRRIAKDEGSPRIKKSPAKKKARTRQKYVVDQEKVTEVQLSVSEQLQEHLEKAKKEKYLKSAFKCEKCVLAFKHIGSFREHMKKHCESSGPLVCSLCEQRFSRESDLAEHRMLHATRTVCKACGKRFADKWRLKDHLNWHDGKVPPCSHCGKTFKFLWALNSHVRLKHGQGRYPCDLCTKVYDAECLLKIHKLRHQTEKPYQCDICPRGFFSAAGLAIHRGAHSPTRAHYCVECDRHYSSAYILREHFRKSMRHKDPSLFKFECQQCPRRFESSTLLTAHCQFSHLGLSAHICGQCGQGFARRHGLTSHIKYVHQGMPKPRNFGCDTCGKKFSGSISLTNHLRVHTGERPFECDICHQMFRQKSTLLTHIQLVHLKIKRVLKPKKL